MAKKLGETVKFQLECCDANGDTFMDLEVNWHGFDRRQVNIFSSDIVRSVLATTDNYNEQMFGENWKQL